MPECSPENVESVGVQELKQILAVSRAANPFKDDVVSFYAGGTGARIQVEGYLPAVKVRRLLKFVLHSEPHLAIERLSLRAASGCSDFKGIVALETSEGRRAFEFVWDCRWRAEEEGWTDYFGLPDQIRAAREFDWRCFRIWRPRGS